MLVLVFVAVFAAFLPVLHNGFVGWDDDLNISDNPSYRGLSSAQLRWMFGTFHGGHYQPLTWVTLGLDYTLWGMNPAGYHLTNLVLHATGAVVLCFVIRRLLASRMAPGAALDAAAVGGALFFALHPLRVESVAWATARRDVLSGLLLLLTLLAYLRMADGQRWSRPAWFVLSLCCFALSLLAKSWGVMLPLVLLVLDAFPLRRARDAPLRTVVEKLPFALLAAAAVAVTLRMLGQFTDVRTLAQHGVTERAAQAAYGLTFYLWKTAVPLGLSPLYPLPPRLDPTEPRFILSALAVVALTVVLIAARRRWPAGLTTWTCYVVLLVPFLGVLQTGPQLVADRYTYLAGIPWAVLLAGGLAWLRRPRAGVIAAAGLVALAALTFQQVRVWRDSRTLWEHALRVDPTNWVAYTNRAVTREAAGDATGALADYNDALRSHPGYPLAYANRGTLRLAVGDVEGAIADLGIAVQLTPHDWRAWNNRGWARQTRGDMSGAIADYTEALRVAPADLPGRAKIEENLAFARARGSGS